jgi:hypothetical protein
MTRRRKFIITCSISFAIAFLGGLALNLYGDYILTSRQLSYLAAKIKLSGISEAVKNQLLSDVYLKSSSKFSFGLSNSNAGFVGTSSISVDCTALTRDFLTKAETCIVKTPDNWWGRAFHSCPAAGDSAETLLKQCNLNLNWR